MKPNKNLLFALALGLSTTTGFVFADQHEQKQMRSFKIEEHSKEKRVPPKEESISKEDYLKRAAQHFDKMDKDRDGILTPQERREKWEHFKKHR